MKIALEVELNGELAAQYAKFAQGEQPTLPLREAIATEMSEGLSADLEQFIEQILPGNWPNDRVDGDLAVYAKVIELPEGANSEAATATATA